MLPAGRALFQEGVLGKGEVPGNIDKLDRGFPFYLFLSSFITAVFRLH